MTLFTRALAILGLGLTLPQLAVAQEQQLIFSDGFEGTQSYFQQAGVQGCGQWMLGSDKAAEGSQYVSYPASLLKPGCYADIFSVQVDMKDPGPKDSVLVTFAIERKSMMGDEQLRVLFVDPQGNPKSEQKTILAYYRGYPFGDKTGWEYHSLKVNAQAFGTGAKVPFIVYFRGETGTRPKNFINLDDINLYYIDYQDGSTSVATASRMGTEGPAINVYPNPTTGAFNISFAEGLKEQAVVTVTDMQGRTVHITTLPATTQAFTHSPDLSGKLSAGLYTVSVNTGNGVSRQMLMVK